MAGGVAARRPARGDGARIRTFLVPPTIADPTDRRNQFVYAVRTDPPPDAAAGRRGLL